MLLIMAMAAILITKTITTMKKALFSTMIASLLAFAGCQQEELVNDNITPDGGEKVILTANIQGAAQTRVSLTAGTDADDNPIVKVEWNESGETFEVIGTSDSSTFTQIPGTNQFEGTLPESTTGKYEVYYGNPNSLDEQDGKLGQSTAIDSPVLMSAMFNSSSPSITFEHATAILKPTFKVNGADIDNSITKIVMDNVAKSNLGNGYYLDVITITPTSPATILDDNIYIHLLVFPQVYIADHEFTFTVTAGDTEYTASLTIPEGMSIEAGKYYTASLSLTETIPYLTFSAESEQTLDLVQTFYEEDEEYFPYAYPGYDGDTGVIEYSVGNSNTWTQFTPDTTDPVTFGGENGDLRLRGKSSKGTLWAKIVFGTDTSVECSGDIRTLVDWENHKTADTSSATFRGLFNGCSVLISAPELPATNLAASCYQSMFYGCTLLTEAPELPATNLAANCYGQMFAGCTSLTEAPVLKAETLVDYCYNSMFNGCSALNDITMLATDINAIDCLIVWVKNVSATGTFTKAANKDLPQGENGIPSGGEVVDYGL